MSSPAHTSTQPSTPWLTGNTAANEVAAEGILRKKGSRAWHDRWLQLKGSRIFVYQAQEDPEPRHVYGLKNNTLVSEIIEDKRYGFTFRLMWPDADGLIDDTTIAEGNRPLEQDRHSGLVPQTVRQGEDKKPAVDKRHQAMKIAGMSVAGVAVGALTFGIGLVAGAIVVGATAAASGSALAYSHATERESKILILAAETLSEAEMWEGAIKAQIFRLSRSTLFGHDGWAHNWGSFVIRETSGSPGVSNDTSIHHSDEFSAWTMEAAWVRELGSSTQGVPMYKPVVDMPFPARMTEKMVHATPLETFICIMSANKLLQGSGLITSLTTIEPVDDHTDVIHIKYRKLLEPSYSQAWPRDFCVVRHWRIDECGSYIICMDSITHTKCPPHPGCVRGDLHWVCTISPATNAVVSDETQIIQDPVSQCLVRVFVQVNPKGWVLSSYLEDFTKAMALQILDIKDSAERSRFLSVYLRDEDLSGPH